MGSHPLKLFWIAFYDKPFGAPDAETFPQFDPETGQENLFRDLEPTRVRSIGWFPFSVEFAERVAKAPGSTTWPVPSFLPPYVVHLQEGQRPIVLRRNFIQTCLGDNGNVKETGQREIIYMLGWQQTHRGRNIKSIMFIHEDGHVELSKNFEHGSPQWSGKTTKHGG